MAPSSPNSGSSAPRRLGPRGGGRRRLLDGRNDEGGTALRAFALHAHVRFFALQQMPLRAEKLKRHWKAWPLNVNFQQCLAIFFLAV